MVRGIESAWPAETPSNPLHRSLRSTLIHRGGKYRSAARFTAWSTCIRPAYAHRLFCGGVMAGDVVVSLQFWASARGTTPLAGSRRSPVLRTVRRLSGRHRFSRRRRRRDRARKLSARVRRISSYPRTGHGPLSPAQHSPKAGIPSHQCVSPSIRYQRRDTASSLLLERRVPQLRLMRKGTDTGPCKDGFLPHRTGPANSRPSTSSSR